MDDTGAPQVPSVDHLPCAQLLADHCALVEGHVAQDHQHDELVRTALFGRIKPTIDNPDHRAEEEGVVYQVAQLHKASQNGGIRTKLRPRDTATIALVVAVVEAVARSV